MEQVISLKFVFEETNKIPNPLTSFLTIKTHKDNQE